MPSNTGKKPGPSIRDPKSVFEREAHRIIRDKVDKDRQVATAAPLSGGGTLGADRTLTVDTFSTSGSGVVPASGGGTTNFLRADGTWASVPAPAPTIPLDVLYGSGVDGSLTFDGSTTILGMAPAASVYTLTRDIMAQDLQVNVGVRIKTAGYRIFALGTATVNGTIDDNGDDAVGTATAAPRTAGFFAATNGGAPSNSVGGNAPTPQPQPYFFNTVSGATGGSGGTSSAAGGTGSAGPTSQGGGGGGAGWSSGDGNGAAGRVAGGISSQTASEGAASIWAFTRGGPERAGLTSRYTFAAQSGGGSSSAGAAGGAGGGDGRIVYLAARTLAGSGQLQCRGGAGGAGQTPGAGHGGGGGGGGGPGGFIVVVYSTNAGLTFDVTGGAGGAGGAGGSGGNAGGNGGAGGAGQIIKYNLSGDGT